VFTERLSVKATALFLSFVLWMVVAGEEPSQEAVDVTLDLALDSSLVLTSGRPAVRAQVIGSARELYKLFSQRPTIRRSFAGDVADSVIVQLSPSDVQLPPGIDARVTAVEPQTFTLHFDSLLQRRMPVRSALRLTDAKGRIQLYEPSFEPESVTVRGQRHVVKDLESVSTVRRTITVRDTLITVEVPLDTLHLEIRVVPARVRAKVPPPAVVTPP
jgi:YbbR domain-containing protein